MTRGGEDITNVCVWGGGDPANRTLATPYHWNCHQYEKMQVTDVYLQSIHTSKHAILWKDVKLLQHEYMREGVVRSYHAQNDQMLADQCDLTTFTP